MLFNLLFVSILSNPTYVSVHLINHSVMTDLFKNCSKFKPNYNYFINHNFILPVVVNHSNHDSFI